MHRKSRRGRPERQAAGVFRREKQVCVEIRRLGFRWFRPKFETSFNPASANSTTQHISVHLFVQDAVGPPGRSLAGNSDGRSAQTQNTGWEHGLYSVVAEQFGQDLCLDPFSLICDKPCPIQSLPPFPGNSTSSGRFRSIESPSPDNHRTDENVPAMLLRFRCEFLPGHNCEQEVFGASFSKFLCNTLKIERSDEPQNQ
tara:strand:+ start:255581 stop:256177 length:597 start_codon:yes stop_codon:yes gene_type:complete